MKYLYLLLVLLLSTQVFAQTTYNLEVENTAIATLSGNVALQNFQGQQAAYINGNSAAEKITYTLNLPANTGTSFNLKINYNLPNSFGSKRQFVKVNGTTLAEYEFSTTNSTYADKEIGQITLNTGANTIEIQASWGFMYVNAISLTGDFGSGLLIGGNRQILQAENSNVANLAGNTTIQTLRSQGSAYFGSATNAEKITFKLNLAQAATLELKISYAILSNLGSKMQFVKVNGNNLGEITFENTSGLFFDKNIGEIAFNAGDNTIEIQASAGLMYVNYLSVSPKPNAAPNTTCSNAPFNVRGSFYVANGKIYDDNCNPFVMRGINLQFGDQINFNPQNALGAIPKIRNLTRSNTLRILLRFAPNENNTTTTKDIKAAVDSCIKYKMVPVLMMYSTVGTGGQNVEQLKDAVNRWVELASEMEGNLEEYAYFKKYGILNILNEFGSNNLPNYPTWKNAYKESITLLRMAGYTNPIMIDAHGYGQLLDVFLGTDGGGKNRATELLEHDPLRNMIFSVHAYFNTWGTDQNISTQVTNMANSGLAFIFGEHGNKQLNPSINQNTIWEKCETANPKIGWLAWSWYGNGGEATVLNMAKGWLPAGLEDFTTFGKEVVYDVYGLNLTAKIATVFGTDDPILTALEFETGEVKSINLFPNPFTEYFYLDINSKSNQFISIKIMDLEGKIVFERKAVFIKQGEERLKFDLPNLKSGLYFLKLQIGNQIISLKLVK